MNLLSAEEREAMARALLPHWQVGEETITCQLKFDDFTAAFAFMTTIAIHAEKMNHHPSWSNTYNILDIELSTHDAGGLTALDFKLGSIIDQQFKRFAIR